MRKIRLALPAIAAGAIGLAVLFNGANSIASTTPIPVDGTNAPTSSEVVTVPLPSSATVELTPTPDRTPVEVPLTTTPPATTIELTPPPGAVMRQEDFPCQEDEVLGYHPRFGPDHVGCIHVDEFPVTW